VQLTPRRRVVIAIIAIAPIAYFYIDYGSFTALNVARHYRAGYTVCDGSWRSNINGCGQSFSPAWASAELIVITLIFLAIAYGLARWAMMPVRQIGASVARFGPTSIGLRLRANGPRDETRQLSDAIDEMLDRLAEGYEAQRRFASNASHELRTPLATQRALIEVSLGSALTSDQLDLVSRQLLATNERNEKLIDGLLTLAETERGLLAHPPQRLDEIVHEAIVMYRVTAAEHAVTVQASLAPTTVNGEHPLLERLAGNLVHNAIKYNHPGGTVHVWVTPDGRLTVANTGPNVAPEQVAALFEPFRRMTGERLDHGGGVGLGLTIARSIVAAHGGSITASANPDGGLTVTAALRPS
jgi:signal transduction histidine kinase